MAQPTDTKAAGLEALLSVEEVQGLLGVSRFTVYRLVSRGELAVVRLGSRTMFEPADVRALIDARRERATPVPRNDQDASESERRPVRPPTDAAADDGPEV